MAVVYQQPLFTVSSAFTFKVIKTMHVKDKNWLESDMLSSAFAIVSFAKKTQPNFGKIVSNQRKRMLQMYSQ